MAPDLAHGSRLGPADPTQPSYFLRAGSAGMPPLEPKVDCVPVGRTEISTPLATPAPTGRFWDKRLASPVRTDAWADLVSVYERVRWSRNIALARCELNKYSLLSRPSLEKVRCQGGGDRQGQHGPDQGGLHRDLPGLYIAALAMVTNTCYMITAAWLLVIGAFDEKTGADVIDPGSPTPADSIP